MIKGGRTPQELIRAGTFPEWIYYHILRTSAMPNSGKACVKTDDHFGLSFEAVMKNDMSTPLCNTTERHHACIYMRAISRLLCIGYDFKHCQGTAKAGFKGPVYAFFFCSLLRRRDIIHMTYTSTAKTRGLSVLVIILSFERNEDHKSIS